jgi:molybdate transport system regulatory protein
MSRDRKPASAPVYQVQPRFRLMCRADIAFGPGKAALLERVQMTGSLAEAATELGMSYMRAWTLVQTMQQCFKKPLLKLARGGARHGGAELTDTGRQVLALYREMEDASLRASRPSWRKLLKLLA